MTQIGESVFADASQHDSGKRACPFCPSTTESFTSFPGDDNDSGKLGEIMADPALLTARQSGCRPKDGQPRRQSRERKVPKPDPIYSHPTHGDYSSEAHHVIPGKQSMSPSRIEQWICSSKGKIKADTGYSINNAANGAWLPSIPERFRNGSWGKKDFSDKVAIAAFAMKKKGQFHKGHHNIGDPDDPAGTTHKRYSKQIRAELNDLSDLIADWSAACFEAESGPPFQPNWKVHNMLDRLSAGIRTNIASTNPKQWRYYISKVALQFHKDSGCNCNR